MTKHTFQINATKTSTKTAAIKSLRETKHVVSANNTVTTTIDDTIRSMIQTGSLTDVCTWHGKSTRKVCGAKPVIRESETSTAALKARIQADVDKWVKPVVKSLYRNANSGWAGGNTHVEVKIQREPYAAGESQRVWSDNGKWSGNDAYLTVAVMHNYGRSIMAVPGLQAAGGMLTTHATKTAEDCWIASWIVQGRGFDINVESGYIVRSAEGEWCHAKSEKAARKLSAKRDAEVIAERERLSIMARRVEGDNDFQNNLDIIVTLADSRSAGNCSTGTQSWINLHFPGRTSATIREIIAADPTNTRALQACRIALRRTRETVTA